MKLSEEGLRLIKSFEGYHTRLEDGSCAAYLCPAGVATIGYGCTVGVKLGMVWTAEQAESALLREISKFEDAVNRNVTVEINQNEFDAMVSLAYNIGAAGFARSSVLRRLNKGDRKGAEQAFHLWNKGGGRVLAGLVSRRMREAALFLKPVEKPEEPFMPQAVVASSEPAKPATVATGAAGAAVVATQVIPGLPVPSVPPEITDSLTNVSAWKGIGEQLWTLKDWAHSQPMLAGAVSLSITAFYLWSKKKAATQ
jgi:lysozyme